MPDQDVKEILRALKGPASVRPGFEDELFALLAAELEAPVVAPDLGPDPSRVKRGLPLGLPDLRRLKSKKWLLAPVAAATALVLLVGTSVWNVDRNAVTEDPRVVDKDAPSTVEGPVGEGTETRGSEDGGSAAGSRPEESIAPGGAPIALPDRGDDSHPGGGEDPSPPLIAAGTDVLAFASKPGDYWHIYTMNADGTHRRRLTDAGAHDREPDWSPDGTKIAFVRLANEADHAGEIYVMDADGSNERLLASGGEPQWSPDGNLIAFTGPPAVPTSTGQPASIWVMHADGSDQRRLFEGEGAAADVTWSPVGGLLAFAGIAPNLPPGPTTGSQTTNLYTMTEKGTLVRRLTDTVYACNSEFSPDGTRLAFITSNGGPFVVWTMAADGSDKTQLTKGPGTNAFPHWSPDGALIAFGFDPDGEPHWSTVPQTAGPTPGSIWSMRTDGTALKRISPPDANDADPAYAPRVGALIELERDRRKASASNDEGMKRAPTKSVC